MAENDTEESGVTSEQNERLQDDHCSGTWFAPLLITFCAAALFVFNLVAPSHYTANDQDLSVAYVLDLLDNGHVLVQRDPRDSIASKPPLYTWLASMSVLLRGGTVSLQAMIIPCFIAIWGAAWLLYDTARRAAGEAAGLFSGLFFLLTPITARLIGVARTDALFGALILLTAVLAFRAWYTGRGWTWFWLAAAATTLTKGPAGVLFAAIGLLAASWPDRAEIRPRFRGSHMLGITLFFALTGGWLFLAWLQEGQDVLDKLIFRELVGHAVGHEERHGSFKPWRPWIHFLGQAAPWGLLTYFGVYWLIAKPMPTHKARWLSRFTIVWFVGGFGILSLVTHFRNDLLFPFAAPAALIAGLTCSRWVGDARSNRLRLIVTVVALIALGAAAHILINVEGAREAPREAQAYQAFNSRILAHEELPPLTFSAPDIRHLFWHQRSVRLTSPWIVVRLMKGTLPAYNIGHNHRWYDRHEFPILEKQDGIGARFISNQTKVKRTANAAFGRGWCLIELRNGYLLEDREDFLRIEPSGAFSITIANYNRRPEPWVIETTTGEHLELTLEPNQTVSWSPGGEPLLSPIDDPLPPEAWVRE